MRESGKSVQGTGEPVRMQGNVVSEGFFRLLGVGAPAGRTFTPAEHRPGADPVAALSHGAWQRYFGADPNVVRSKRLVNGQPEVVVGVLPPLTVALLPARRAAATDPLVSLR